MVHPEAHLNSLRDSSIKETGALGVMFRLYECTTEVVRARELAEVEAGRVRTSLWEEEGVEAARVRST